MNYWAFWATCSLLQASLRDLKDLCSNIFRVYSAQVDPLDAAIKLARCCRQTNTAYLEAGFLLEFVAGAILMSSRSIYAIAAEFEESD